MAEKVINQKDAMESTQFFEDKQSEKRERLFMEFNSLSVVYGRPSEKFLKDAALKQSIASERKHYPKERGFQTSDQDRLLQDDANAQANAGEAEQPVAESVDNLLDMGGPSTNEV